MAQNDMCWCYAKWARLFWRCKIGDLHMSRRLVLQLSTAIITTIGAGIFTSPAFAAADAAAASADAASTLEEVTVTAQRFSGNLQTTPIAVSAFTPTTLETRQINNVSQAAAQIPGLVITPATGTNNSARIVLRGAGQEQSGIQFDPAVGVYIDNVYQPRINGGFFDFFDIGQLEVLRGPQGTLYGRNTSGGAIKITTARPSFQLTYGGDATFGSYNTRDARGYISGPLVEDKLAFSLSGVTRNRDGWTNDPAYGRDVNNKKFNGARAKLLFTPNEKFEIEAAVDVQEDHSDPGIGSPIQLLGLVPPNALDPAAVPGRDLFTSELFGPISAKADSIGGSINAKFEVSPNLTINSITGYRNMRATQAESFTLSKNAAGTLSPIGGSYLPGRSTQGGGWHLLLL
jgi:iron complex outermembrane receptor protein